MSVVEKRRGEVHCLPPGWRREEIIRKTGLSAGKVDIYYYSPDGRKVRSKPELARLLGDKLDLASFDFRSGKMISLNVHKRMRQDSSLVLPIRQTASIFKQPVTVVRNHPESKTRTDLRHGIPEQPRQLFWEKRLQGLSASDCNGEKMNNLQLPHAIQGVSPELLGNESLLHSIAAALHLNNQPITGQTLSRALIQRNPGVNMNADQPLIQSVVISDHDIQKQENRVFEARKRLQQAMVTCQVK